jgi:preprotein translocase subunit SecD
MKKILLFLSGFLIVLAAHGEVHPAEVVFQMRLVAEKPSGDTQEMKLAHKVGTQSMVETLYVGKDVLLDQSAIQSAEARPDVIYGKPIVHITFTKAGKQRFAELTRDHIYSRLAIIIGGRLYSAPRISSEIRSGDAEISGDFSMEKAQQLASRISESLGK